MMRVSMWAYKVYEWEDEIFIVCGRQVSTGLTDGLNSEAGEIVSAVEGGGICGCPFSH